MNAAGDGMTTGTTTVGSGDAAVRDAGPSEAAARGDTGPSEAAARRRGSLPDLVRSLVVIVGLVGVAVLLFPRPNQVPAATVDVERAAASVADRAGFEPAVPAGLPSGWAATGTWLLDGTDHTPSWRVTYRTPAGHPVGFIQGLRPTLAWENHMVMDGRPAGTRVVDGQRWLLRSRPDRGHTNLVLRQRDVTTVVTGRADLAELETLIRSLPLPG